MKGLILKDIYVIKMHGIGILKIAGLILALTELMALSVRCGNLKALYSCSEEIEESILPVTYIIIACLFLCGFCSYEIADCDEKTGFKTMLRSMPVNIKSVVTADYCCFFGVIISTYVVAVVSELCFVLTLGVGIKGNQMFVIYAIAITFVVMQCVLLPFMYIKSKAPLLAAGVLYMLVMGLAVLISGTCDNFGISTIKNVYKWVVRLSEIIIPVAIFASYKASVAVAKRRIYIC